MTGQRPSENQNQEMGGGQKPVLLILGTRSKKGSEGWEQVQDGGCERMNWWRCWGKKSRNCSAHWLWIDGNELRLIAVLLPVVSFAFRISKAGRWWGGVEGVEAMRRVGHRQRNGGNGGPWRWMVLPRERMCVTKRRERAPSLRGLLVEEVQLLVPASWKRQITCDSILDGAVLLVCRDPRQKMLLSQRWGDVLDGWKGFGILGSRPEWEWWEPVLMGTVFSGDRARAEASPQGDSPLVSL